MRYLLMSVYCSWWLCLELPLPIWPHKQRPISRQPRRWKNKTLLKEDLYSCLATPCLSASRDTRRTSSSNLRTRFLLSDAHEKNDDFLCLQLCHPANYIMTGDKEMEKEMLKDNISSRLFTPPSHHKIQHKEPCDDASTTIATAVLQERHMEYIKLTLEGWHSYYCVYTAAMQSASCQCTIPCEHIVRCWQLCMW